MDAGFFKGRVSYLRQQAVAYNGIVGTSTDQDKRFSDKEAKLLKSMKFPPEFEKKVCTNRF
jgi:hypothetical protein